MHSLDQISIGTHAVIVKLHMRKHLRRRLTDLGFTPGSTVLCVGESIFCDPRAYQAHGCVIALRNQDAKDIEVR